MNVERPNFALSLPATVKLTGDQGVYLCLSKSRKELCHRVDVTLLQCSCESAVKGVSRQSFNERGYLPRPSFCAHLREALIFHAIACIAALEDGQRKAAR